MFLIYVNSLSHTRDVLCILLFVTKATHTRRLIGRYHYNKTCFIGNLLANVSFLMPVMTRNIVTDLHNFRRYILVTCVERFLSCVYIKF